MLRRLFIACLLLTAGSQCAAEDELPAGVELTSRGRVSIRRVTGFKLPSANLRQIPLPGSKRPSPVGIYELRAVPLAIAVQALAGQQQLKIENQELLPAGQFDLDIYFWHDEKSMLPILERSLRDTFGIELEFTSQTRSAYKLRKRTDDDEPPSEELAKAPANARTLRWKGRPTNVATGISRQLNVPVTSDIADDQAIAIELKVNPTPALADVERQVFEQGFVLERADVLIPVIKIHREE
jgi:hypothetical protein